MSSHAAAVPAPEEHLDAHTREAVENVRLGFWIFLGSESVFFATLIGTYLALHTHIGKGPGPHSLDIGRTMLATIALSFSGLTMALAVGAGHRRNIPRLRTWLVVTIVLGLMFVANQVVEFTSLYHSGLTLTSSAFGSSFFTLTGFHGLHVTFGCVWLIVWLLHTKRNKPFTERDSTLFEIAGLYWAFVDVVWIVIFTVVYLIGVLV